MRDTSGRSRTAPVASGRTGSGRQRGMHRDEEGDESCNFGGPGSASNASSAQLGVQGTPGSGTGTAQAPLPVDIPRGRTPVHRLSHYPARSSSSCS